MQDIDSINITIIIKINNAIVQNKCPKNLTAEIRMGSFYNNISITAIAAKGSQRPI